MAEAETAPQGPFDNIEALSDEIEMSGRGKLTPAEIEDAVKLVLAKITIQDVMDAVRAVERKRK